MAETRLTTAGHTRALTERDARLAELERAVIEAAKAETYAERISQLDLLPKLQVRRHEAVDALEGNEREGQ